MTIRGRLFLKIFMHLSIPYYFGLTISSWCQVYTGCCLNKEKERKSGEKSGVRLNY
jgi:hypothetical protein